MMDFQEVIEPYNDQRICMAGIHNCLIFPWGQSCIHHICMHLCKTLSQNCPHGEVAFSNSDINKKQCAIKICQIASFFDTKNFLVYVKCSQFSKKSWKKFKNTLQGLRWDHKGPFKYYIIMFLTFLNQPTHLFDDLQYCKSSKIAIF